MSTTEEKPITKDEPLAKVEAEEISPPTSCGILGRYPVLSVLVFATVGLGVGIGLSFWEDDGDAKDTTLKWIGLLGDLFIRSLKCVVLPLVFINVVISVMDMMQIGKAGSVGWKTVGLYLLTTVSASIVGIISIVSFKGLFEEGDFEDSPPPTISLGCSKGVNGTVVCTADYASDEDKMFNIVDVTGSFSKSSSGARNDISLSDTIYNGVFTKLVTSNITGAFVSANFAAIVFFAIVFGVALSRVQDRKKTSGKSALLEFFKDQLDHYAYTLRCLVIDHQGRRTTRGPQGHVFQCRLARYRHYDRHARSLPHRTLGTVCLHHKE
jgi:hypothetical protein